MGESGTQGHGFVVDGELFSGECPQSGYTISEYQPPAAAYRSSTARVWATIGCGGQSASPGHCEVGR